jgi:hypothetical protein
MIMQENDKKEGDSQPGNDTKEELLNRDRCSMADETNGCKYCEMKWT